MSTIIEIDMSKIKMNRRYRNQKKTEVYDTIATYIQDLMNHDYNRLERLQKFYEMFSFIDSHSYYIFSGYFTRSMDHFLIIVKSKMNEFYSVIHNDVISNRNNRYLDAQKIEARNLLVIVNRLNESIKKHFGFVMIN